MKKKNNKQQNPIVEFTECKFTDSQFKSGKYVYKAESLYEQAKKESAVAFDYPLAAYDLSWLGFNIKDADDFVYHMRRVMNTDTSIPIIISPKGQIADGYHRVMRALLDGKSTIKAYRLKEFPYADHVETDSK